MKQQKTEAEIEQLIEQLKKITRKDGTEKYVEAQFELGRIYSEYKKDWQKAIKHLLNIKKQDNPMAYAGAQLNLGVIYQKIEHKIEQAEHCYLNVKKQDNPMAYAGAQLNLGVIYQEIEHNIEQAEHCYLNVKKQDNPMNYAQAQLNLGITYQYEKQDIGQAKQCYLNVKKQDNPEVYSYAQLFLGTIFQNEKYISEQAEWCYLNVEKQYNPKVYAIAQFYLGIIYNMKGDVELAKQCYLNIEKQDNPKLYFSAQEILGGIYRFLGDRISFNSIEQDKELADEYYQSVAYSDFLFKDYITAQTMLSVIKNKNVSIFKDERQRNTSVIDPICKIRSMAESIQMQLHVTFKLDDVPKTEKIQFERQVAHYTKPEVLFNLLKNKNKPSDFRLNVIDFMNDPTENQVLTDWLDVKTEKDNEIKTFLASFSFNHNSLNQFRLYGNENNIVGSSVSVVFNKKFFGDDINKSINPASINYFFNNTDFGLAINDSAKSVVATMGLNNSNENLNQKSDNTRNDLIVNSNPKNSETVTEKNITSSVGSLPLFRCLYFDPKNGYISIAKRNKYSFYLEHQRDSPENIDAKWNNYLQSLNEEAKINTVREKLQQIEEIIHSLKNPEEPKQKEIIEKITNLDQLIALALMPISCLVKHAAFEDEDECRMIYITNIADDLIQAPEDYAYANSLFVNYGKIEDYLEKIYLGPQCQPHHKLWITNHVRTSQSKTRSKPIKVVQSEMPLR